MKLYTEEQVKKAYDKGLDNGFWGNSSNEQEDMALKELKPIELPSDEEIEEDMKNQSGEYACGWEDAFNWMKKQILNQNK